MTDVNLDYVPTLTFESTPTTPAAQAAAAQAIAEEKAPAMTATQAEESQLTAEELKLVNDFAEKIDITDSNAILQYGASSQKNIADFSGTTLNSVRTKDMGEVGGMLSNLVVELKGFNYGEEEKKGFLGLFKKAENKIAMMKAQYDKAEVNVDKICDELEKHQVTLLKDVSTLDKMYNLNQQYFKELTMYILAGKKKLKECEEVVLPQLQEKARQSGLPEDAQAVNDYQNMISRFDKKIHDLELTRMISIQMSPQIRLIQNNDTLMVEKIQTSLVNTIPLWKSQMVLALGMHHSQQAMEAQREVTNVTNELLRKNAEALKTGSIEVAKESERGIVDLETLKHTNQTLIDTLEEVRSIQADGAAKRRAAEVELGRIETELREKLVQINK
ncbi:MAG: toxic anion resistance protein [Oscillospiraceae bacterium]|nr:toxic anion resistance protein [Oscillospiraceae bacterium]MBQ2329829.1 toxic anion resistance protein [Oscillospiraceae bacterium]MBQ3951874.1 toxic anion resistance protein [Oscillospiraceae bacterium]MBQ3986469.1 toxic anion resistance protein [Oscillospiraceae bacterium]MBQ5503562.1 toxic anion resistance protein [Oscillospiraceae bacterium]